MTKLLLVIPTLDRSGAEKQFTLLAEGLPRDEFDVRTVALTRGGPYAERLEAAGIPVTVLGKRWKFDPFALRRLRRLIREWRPDVINSWLFAASAYCRLVAGGTSGPPVVVSERCVDSWKAGWQTWLDRRQIGRTAKLVGNSRAVVEFYRELGHAGERTAVVHNAIEVTAPEGDAESRAAILSEFDVPESSRVVAVVGRLARQKRVNDLVWAMQLLRQLVDDVSLLIVGDGPERRTLVDLATHFECDHLIRFVGHRDDVPRLLRAVDVFWLGSDFEGLSNATMEAMAAGVPVVVGDIPPNRELVTDGETGVIVPVGDSPGFAKATRDLLDDPERRRTLGERGRARMRTEFSVSRMVTAYAALFREVAGTAESSSPAVGPQRKVG